MPFPDQSGVGSVRPRTMAAAMTPQFELGADLRLIAYPRPLSLHDGQARAQDFVVYDQSSLFYRDVVAARAGGSRDRLQEVASAFLRGTPPYGGRFVDNVTRLEAPMNRFPRIELRLRSANHALPRTGEELRNALATELAIDLPGYLSSDTYQSQKARVWDSYLALAILSAPRPVLLDALTCVLVMCRLIERLSGREPALATPRGVEKAVRARVLLPPHVFPLPPAIPVADADRRDQDPTDASPSSPDGDRTTAARPLPAGGRAPQPKWNDTARADVDPTPSASTLVGTAVAPPPPAAGIEEPAPPAAIANRPTRPAKIPKRRQVVPRSGRMCWPYPGVGDLLTIEWNTIHAATRDGRSVHCDLGLLGRPLDSCPLRISADPDDTSYFFDLEYRGYFAVGVLLLRTDERTGETWLAAQLRYGRDRERFRGSIGSWLTA